MKFFLLLGMLPFCNAAPQDLTGKMFTFPQKTRDARVRLRTTEDTFEAATVCLRFFTDLTRSHVLFSMSIPSNANAILLFKKTTQIELDVMSTTNVNFQWEQYKLDTWHDVCATWDSKTGVGQLWLDGRPTTRKLLKSGTIKGNPNIMIGQEQDNHGGGFDEDQCFIGMMSDVHMWNYVLSPCEIQRYMDDLNFSPGNVINWRALEFETVGKVVLEENQKGCV